MKNRRKNLKPLLDDPAYRLPPYRPLSNPNPYTPEGSLEIGRRTYEHLWGKGAAKSLRLKILLLAIGLVFAIILFANLISLVHL